MTEVLIVGGGPVGLMTALGLARECVAVTLLEAEDQIVYSPRAISYAWSILPALELFGVLGDMIAVGHTVDDRCWRIFGTGETIAYNHDAVRGSRVGATASVDRRGLRPGASRVFSDGQRPRRHQ